MAQLSQKQITAPDDVKLRKGSTTRGKVVSVGTPGSQGMILYGNDDDDYQTGVDMGQGFPDNQNLDLIEEEMDNERSNAIQMQSRVEEDEIKTKKRL